MLSASLFGQAPQHRRCGPVERPRRPAALRGEVGPAGSPEAETTRQRKGFLRTGVGCQPPEWTRPSRNPDRGSPAT